MRINLEIEAKNGPTQIPLLDETWKITSLETADKRKHYDLTLEENGNPSEVYSMITQTGCSIVKSKITQI